MQRFFLPAERVSHGQVEFLPEQARQIAVVLRLRPGDRVAVLDYQGWISEVELSRVAPNAAGGVVRSRTLAPNEPRTKLTLYPALLKSDKLELVLQKCTEIGASGFAPTICDRCNVGSIISENRRLRWERILVEAAEQCERGRIPQLHPAMIFPQACEQASSRGLSFIAQERDDRPSLRAELSSRIAAAGARPFAMNLFIGPEGGFTDEELAVARSYGIIGVGLGPRILRAETAAFAGTTLVMALAGDLE
ncbi:MAG: RsmE family RNA methyltransferase [Chloroflexota bacterium]